MLNLTDLKPGVSFEMDGSPYLVMASEHSKLGRGGAILRSKIKNLLTGAIIDHTFKGSDTFEESDIERKKAQFLYKDEKKFYFMAPDTFEQFSLVEEQIGDSSDYMKEGVEAEILYHKNKPLSLQLPIKMDFKVTYTEPGFKGNTVSATNKSATIETGAEVQVPLFVKNGDTIRIDTRTGTYVERV